MYHFVYEPGTLACMLTRMHMREQFVKVEIRVYLVSALFTYSLTFDVIKEKDLCGKNVLKNYVALFLR